MSRKHHEQCGSATGPEQSHPFGVRQLAVALLWGACPRCARLAAKWLAYPTHLPCHAIRLRRFVCMEGRNLRASTNRWIRASNAAWLDGCPSLVFRHGHRLRCSTHTKTRTARHRVTRIRLCRWPQHHNALQREQARWTKAQASLRTPGSHGWCVPRTDLRSDAPLECGSLLSLFYGELAPRCARLASNWLAYPTHLPCHAIRLLSWTPEPYWSPTCPLLCGRQ